MKSKLKLLYSSIRAILSTTVFLSSTTFAQTSFQKPAGDSYTINGILRGHTPEWIYMAHLDTLQKIAKIDSTKVINGKFQFSGTVAGPELCYLGKRLITKEGKKSGIGFSGRFILDKGALQISGHSDSIPKLKAWGLPAQDQLRAFTILYTPLMESQNTLYGKSLSAEKKKDKVLLNTIRKAQEQGKAKIRALLMAQVNAYPDTWVTGFLIRENSSNFDAKDLEDIYNLFGPTVKSSFYGNFVRQKFMAENRTAVGNLAPAFELPTPSGEIISLAAYKGKYTLIDFWASWCGPCRMENPNLIKAYQAYKSKGFEVLSISMDADRQAWLKAVQEDKLPWVQVSDLKGSKSEIKTLYGITVIPMNFLLSPEGKIIERNLTGRKLHEALEKHLAANAPTTK